MAYTLEHIFSLSVPGAINMEYDGRYLWVTTGSNITIVEWWGAFSYDEPEWETLDETTYPRVDEKKLRVVNVITTTATDVKKDAKIESLFSSKFEKVYSEPRKDDVVFDPEGKAGKTALSTPYWIKRCNGKMYVTNGANFTRIFEFDIGSQKLLSEIVATPVPDPSANSNLCVSGGKLWYVGTLFNDVVLRYQRLYSFDPITKARTETDIPVRPQVTRAWLTTGYNGHVYVTNFNNVSVCRFSDVTGAFVNQIRVNAEPTHIFTGPDRRIWVSSFGGMISLIDYDDNGVHNDYAVGIGDDLRGVSMQTDPSNGALLWVVTTDNLLVRHNLNTHEQLELGPPTADPEEGVKEVKIEADAPRGKQLENVGDEDLVFTDPDENIVTLPVGGLSDIYAPGTSEKTISVTSGEANANEIPNDWEIQGTFGTDTDLVKPEIMWISQPFVYQDQNLTVKNVKPYMFLIQGDDLVAIRLERYLYREVYTTITGQAAVVMGPYTYFGD